MADMLKRMRQLIGSSADWAANNIVIGDGELALERTGGTIQLKVGNGGTQYSALPYVSLAGGGILWGSIQNKPTSFQPAAHTHQISDVVGLKGELAGKVASSLLTRTGGKPAYNGLVPQIGPQGTLDASLMPSSLVGAMHYVGTWGPTAGNEYPATPTVGDTYVVIGPDYPMTGGDLNGTTVRVGDMMIYGPTPGGGPPAGTWTHVDQHGAIAAAGGISEAAADAKYILQAGQTVDVDATLTWPTAGATAGNVIIEGGNATSATIKNVTLSDVVLDMGVIP